MHCVWKMISMEIPTLVVNTTTGSPQSSYVDVTIVYKLYSKITIVSAPTT